MKQFEITDINLADLKIWEIAEMCELDEEQEEILKAALDAGFDTEEAVEKILDNSFELIAGVTTYKELGWYYAENVIDLPEVAYPYFNFEKFGAEVASNEDGYLTSYGWLTVC